MSDPRTPEEIVERCQPAIQTALQNTIDLNVTRGFEHNVAVQAVTAATIAAAMNVYVAASMTAGVPGEVAQDRFMTSVADMISDQRERAARSLN